MTVVASEPVRLANLLLRGRRLERTKKFGVGGWQFYFDGNIVLTVETGWRLVSDTTILVTNEDDKQMFGRTAPADTAVEAMSALFDKSVTGVLIEPVCSDLTIHFGATLRVDVLNLSSGYEAWTLAGQDGLLLVGRNGQVILFPGETAK
jgi:Family of unknown function (DUF6188)